jgi:hypothetical protein
MPNVIIECCNNRAMFQKGGLEMAPVQVKRLYRFASSFAKAVHGMAAEATRFSFKLLPTPVNEGVHDSDCSASSSSSLLCEKLAAYQVVFEREPESDHVEWQLEQPNPPSSDHVPGISDGPAISRLRCKLSPPLPPTPMSATRILTPLGLLENVNQRLAAYERVSYLEAPNACHDEWDLSEMTLQPSVSDDAGSGDSKQKCMRCEEDPSKLQHDLHEASLSSSQTPRHHSIDPELRPHLST